MTLPANLNLPECGRGGGGRGGLGGEEGETERNTVVAHLWDVDNIIKPALLGDINIT